MIKVTSPIIMVFNVFRQQQEWVNPNQSSPDDSMVIEDSVFNYFGHLQIYRKSHAVLFVALFIDWFHVIAEQLVVVPDKVISHLKFFAL